MTHELCRILRCVATTAITCAVALASIPAWAAGSNMPWEIIIVTGLSLAFGDTSGGFRRLIQIVFGLSIAFAASSFFLSFFSFGGGVLV
jgi:type IV secretion system protein TrbC